ncbi:MAG TPA: hypothetical protein DCX01_09025 [Bacteroidetes bacterium]|nr:hypothetical protein [Bacteroidota bacterium]
MIKLIKKTTLILTLGVSVFLLSQCNDKEPLAPQNSQYTTSFSSGRYYMNLNFLSWCNLDKFYEQ